MQQLIIDTDGGIDDALALLMAFAAPAAAVSAITTVAGNAVLEHVVHNVARLLDLCAQDVPFFRGASGPLVGTLATAAEVHGEDGFGDAGVAASTRQPQAEHAVLALLRLANAAPGEYTLVTLGPLTNLALAVRLDPALPSKFKRVVVMGGTIAARGNIGVVSEYNIHVDPEAAQIVLDTFPALTLVSWETTLRHGLEWAWLDRWLNTNTPKGRFMAAITRGYARRLRARGIPHYYYPDPLAMAVALHPEIVLLSDRRYGMVELHGGLTRGQTVIDWAGKFQRPHNLDIVQDVDLPRFVQLLDQALA